MPATIELLGGQWEPLLPASFVQRQEILLSFDQGVEGSHQLRVWAAALGATWNHPERSKKPEATLAECGYSPRLYGQKIADELIAAGVRVGEIIVQGAIAYSAIAASIIPQSEVDARADFTEADGDATPAPAKAKAL